MTNKHEDKLSAEEIVEKLGLNSCIHNDYICEIHLDRLNELIEQFAAEKVEETVIQMDKTWNETCKEARADALEEASRVCNSMKVCGCKDRILSLKDRKI